ncbi:MAG: hypothetical protein P1U85_05145 [Verrucomicrobiales bacterium]|nr:hypothetical protein [Verrucomicrobiales bacterium]
MRLIPSFPPLLLVLFLVHTIPSLGLSQAKSDPAIRATLENAYNAWRSAMDSQDLKRWEQATALSRQIDIRNRIVSQKLPFPQALFEDPIGAPPLGGLFALGVLSTGETATSTYFGKANFGEAPGAAITDNMIVLHFLKEEGSWRFDTLRVVKMGADSGILLQIRNRDYSFLQSAEFQPAPQLPPLPQPVETPDFVAEAWIDATGYELTLTVNGIKTGTFPNMKGAELLIGGLKKGQNQVTITSRHLPEAQAGAGRVEVAIYAARDASGKASRVFHYLPGADVLPSVSETFVVE